MLNLLLALGILPALLLLRRFYYSYIMPNFIERPVGGIPRPPLVADWIPFIGNGLRMTQGDGFWRDVIRQYGPVVRVRAMGEVRTFVTTPGQLISYVYKNSRNFSFLHFRRTLHSTIFGLQMSHAQSDAMTDKLFPQHHREMQPGSIADLIRKYADHLEDGMKRKVEQIGEEGIVIDLVEDMFDILYEASAKAFFSPSFPHASFKPTFMAFDEAFPLLYLAGLPKIARRSAEKIREDALRMIEEWWVDISFEDRKEIAPAMLGMVEVAEGEGWSLRDVASFFLQEIWALEANAPYAGIWTILELLRNPGILARVRTEITNVISTLSPPTLSTLLHRPQPGLPGLLPITNAVFQETLRFHVDTLSLRVVQEDCVVPPSLIPAGIGKETGLRLYRGDQVICATRVPMVDEEEWGPDAGKWDPERFMKGGAQGRAMHPFGGGVSMCEGRHFASAEILTFIAAFTYLFDADVLSDTIKPNPQRIGLGIQQPMGSAKEGESGSNPAIETVHGMGVWRMSVTQ
ncbi:cytochrome P450 [Dioszegia hungarica]|uniref:Cytochrome P450 n=1 Tax=Dioszegia hungarica TaxID=4972 RepID=A0AA38LTT5_9TREE|nr:cytochrome P450 [Dioszegia hungarica]KAI9632941.1 cytochrome P450 [Dioszegia hungarica]